MPKRLLFLIPCGRLIPSGVRRVLGYLPLLKRDGYRCRVLSYHSSLAHRARELWPVPTPVRWLHQKVRYGDLLRRLDRRHMRHALARMLLGARECDAVFIQWVHPPKTFTGQVKAVNPRVIYDFDDAVFVGDPENVGFLVANAHTVSTGSHFNLDYARIRAQRAVFLPTPVPVHPAYGSLPSRPSSSSEIITIGWLGGTSTLRYLEILREPLAQIARRFPGRIRFWVIGCATRRNEIPAFPGVPVEITPWATEKEFPHLIPQFDVGVMPLLDGDTERGKCGAKALWYMSFGVPTVCSDVGESRYIVADGVNGFLVRDSRQWAEALERLIRDPQLRQEVGRKGHETVQARYSTEACYEILRNQVLVPALS